MEIQIFCVFSMQVVVPTTDRNLPMKTWWVLYNWFTVFFLIFFYFFIFLNFKIFNSYMRSQTWTPLPPPSPQHLSGSSPCTSSKHAVSCIRHRLAIQFLHDSIHVRMSFSQVIPPSPSPSESKSPLYCWYGTRKSI